MQSNGKSKVDWIYSSTAYKCMLVPRIKYDNVKKKIDGVSNIIIIINKAKKTRVTLNYIRWTPNKEGEIDQLYLSILQIEYCTPDRVLVMMTLGE